MAIAVNHRLPEKRPTHLEDARLPLCWLALGTALLTLLLILFIGQTSGVEPDPALDPYRSFGIAAFITVLVVAAYTLRRRWVRHLPGRVQDWLWVTSGSASPAF